MRAREHHLEQTERRPLVRQCERVSQYGRLQGHKDDHLVSSLSLSLSLSVSKDLSPLSLLLFLSLQLCQPSGAMSL